MVLRARDWAGVCNKRFTKEIKNADRDLRFVWDKGLITQSGKRNALATQRG